MDESRALWELVVVGLVSGAAGALLTTLLRIRHERSEQLRDRMIEAADDCSTGLQQALMALGNITAEDADDIRLSGKLPKMISEGRRRKDEVLARMGRIQLLFGTESATTLAGYDSLTAFVLALDGLELANPLDRESAGAVQGHLRQSADRMLEFNRQARKAIKRAQWKD